MPSPASSGHAHEHRIRSDNDKRRNDKRRSQLPPFGMRARGHDHGDLNGPCRDRDAHRFHQLLSGALERCSGGKLGLGHIGESERAHGGEAERAR